jgi:sporulation protein YlmC with PRC-barrel domain
MRAKISGLREFQMNRQLFTSIALAIGVCTLFVVASAQAQRTKDDQPRPRNQPNQQQPETDRDEAGQLDEATHGANIRASQMIGMGIENSEGQSVGEVNDIVIDAANAEVRYAAVTYGGFLGIGDKMFAVPFEAFDVKHDPDDPDAHILVLDVTQRQLEGAEGFDENNWPDFGDHEFCEELDRRYGIDRDGRVNAD